MKLHDLHPAAGSRKARTRVGRGIAAGKGKTAGRGTKGQKARAGGSIPAWFEGGQTPIHVRVPKLRGFKRRDRVEYQVVNVGRLSAYAEAGRLGGDVVPGTPLTVNPEVLAAAGLVASSSRPVKVLGGGEVAVGLFVAAEAFTASARRKIEAAGGFVQSLSPAPSSGEEVPTEAAVTESEPAPGQPETEAATADPTGSAEHPRSEPAD